MPGVDALVELLTMHLGPDQLLVAARVDFSGDITGDDAEDLASTIDRQLAERLPVTSHVFIDPTPKLSGKRALPFHLRSPSSATPPGRR